MLSYPEYLRRLPKAELHCHLIGAIRPTTLIELADRHGVGLPSRDPLRLFAYDNIADFLTVFAAAASAVRDPPDLERVAYEGVEDAVRCGNLRYRECFVNPTNYPHLGYDEVMGAVSSGLRAAEHDFGAGFGIIAAIDRREPPDAAVGLVRAVAAHPRSEVVGLGQDYLTPEGRESPGLFVEAYRLAESHGIKRTAHAGEIPSSTAGDVAVALRDLHCARIDHGYHVLDDPAVVASARSAGIPFTCTPFSTKVLSGWPIGPDHPVARMIRAGLVVTLSTDDPTFFRTDLGSEYADTLPAMGFGPDVARQIALAGIDACWAPEEVKGALRRQFAAEIDRLDAELDPAVHDRYAGR